MPSALLRSTRALHRVGFALVVLAVAIGCTRFDTTRAPAAEETLGEAIVRTFCERMAADAFPDDVSGLRWKPVCRATVPPPDDAPPRVLALLAHRDRLVAALDTTIRPDTHDDLGLFLGDMLPFYDPPRERLPTNTRLIAGLLDSIAHDPEALAALARMGTRTGYRPLRLGLGLVRPILSYPEFDSFADIALRAITDLPPDLPGGDTDGLVATEWSDIQRALSLQLASMEPAEPLPAGQLSTLALTRDLLFTVDPAFSSGGASRYVVRRDLRGIALPRDRLAVFPFADVDGDAHADVDDLGRYLDQSGGLLDVPRPFPVLGESGVPRDPGGRALTSGGAVIYEYLNADRTLLAGVVREGVPWFSGDHPVVLDLTHGLPALLGGPTTREHTYGGATLTYPGFDTEGSSAIDMVYALSELMHLPETEPLLESIEVLIRDHESDAAGVVDAAHYMLDRGERYPDAALEAGNSFWDDMIEMAISFSHRPGMLEAIIRSFADPRSAQLGDVYGGLMRFRDRIDYDPTDVNGDPIGFPLDQRVDRSQPDVDGNESLFERSIALIDGLNGVRVCNREGAVLHLRAAGVNVRWPLFGSYAECELLDIPNVAEAYALSILGRYELPLNDGILNGLIDFLDGLGVNVDDILQSSSQILGLTRHPTPQALNRLVFWGTQMQADGVTPNNVFVHDLLEPVIDRHGNDVVATYHGTIFAWEQPGFYEGMTPLLEVLHDARWRLDDDGNYAFGRLLGTLYGHWPTRSHWHTSRTASDPDFNHQDDGRSYEECIADGMVEGHLVRNMQRAASTLDGLDFDGQDGLDVLAEAANQMLDPDRNEGLRTRAGATSVLSSDRSHPVLLSPVQLILLALRNVDRDLAATDPERVEAWRRGRNALTAQLLDTDPLGSSYEFHNQRGRAIVAAILPFLRGRLTEHRLLGDIVPWARELPGDTEETLAGPLAAGLILLLDHIQSDPASRDALVALISYLLDESSPSDAFPATLYAAADMLQVLDDDANIVPLAHALSAALAPNARDLAGGVPGAPDIENSVTTDALGLVRELQGIDESHVLRRLLANLVAIPEDGDETTPLETILDVLGEVNRAEPGAGGAYEVRDYEALFGEVTGFMLDERRGMERLYQVVQNRECFGVEHDTPCDDPGRRMRVDSELCGEGACVCEAYDDGPRWHCDIRH
jgi:hypothetical protein